MSCRYDENGRIRALNEHFLRILAVSANFTRNQALAVCLKTIHDCKKLDLTKKTNGNPVLFDSNRIYGPELIGPRIEHENEQIREFLQFLVDIGVTFTPWSTSFSFFFFFVFVFIFFFFVFYSSSFSSLSSLSSSSSSYSSSS